MLRLNCLYCGQPLRLNYRLTGPLLVFLTVLLVFLVPHSRSLCGCTAESLPPSAPHAITSQALYARECSRPSPLHVPHAPPAPRAPHSRYSPTSTFLALLLTLLALLLTLLALLTVDTPPPPHSSRSPSRSSRPSSRSSRSSSRSSRSSSRSS